MRFDSVSPLQSSSKLTTLHFSQDLTLNAKGLGVNLTRDSVHEKEIGGVSWFAVFVLFMEMNVTRLLRVDSACKKLLVHQISRNFMYAMMIEQYFLLH